MTGMIDHLGIVAKGRAALLAGNVSTEAPPVEGQARWGIALLLRPDPGMLARLADFGARAAEMAGGGHWAHGADGLHVSICPLERYHEEIGDVTGYVAALREAAAGWPALRASVRTVNPHPLGVGVHVHPEGDSLDLLDQRLGLALRQQGWTAMGHWTRGLWYTIVVHFAGQVDVDRLIAWSDKHRDVELGVTTLSTVELVRYRFTGKGMQAETLYKEALRDHGVVTPF